MNLKFLQNKIFRTFGAAFFSACLFGVAGASAAVVTWDGGGGVDTNWDTCTNWTNNTCPTTSDVATFDATSTTNTTINTAISVAGFDINTGYAGTITQASGVIVTIGTTGYDQAAGTFTGGNSAITDNGKFALSAGTFTSTTGVFSVKGNWTHTAGGTFTHNSGTVTYNGTGCSTSWDVATTEEFYNLTINETCTTGAGVTVSSGDTLNINGALTLTDGGWLIGTIAAKGSVSIAAGFGAASLGSGTLIISGTDSQAVTIAPQSTADVEMVYQFTVSNSSATVSGTGGAGTLYFNRLTIQAGTVALADYSMTAAAAVSVGGGNLTSTTASAINFSSSFAISSGSFNAGSSTVTHTGTLTISGGTYTASTGTTNVKDDWTHTAGGTFTHSSGTVVYNRASCSANWNVASTEEFYAFTVDEGCASGGIVISSGDTLNINGPLTLTDGGWVTGTIAAKGSVSIGSGFGYTSFSSGTLLINGTGSQTVSIAPQVSSSVEIADQFTLNNASATVSGTGGAGTIYLDKMTLQAGTMALNDYSLVVSEAASVAGASLTFTTAPTITFSSTFAISSGSFSAGSATVTHTSTFTISGGTYTASTGTSTFSNTWTHTAGGTFNHSAGTVAFSSSASSMDVATSETFGSFTLTKTGGAALTLTSGDTLIVTGTLTLTDGLLSTGTIEAQGNVVVGSTFDGGTTPLKFTGSASTQNFDLTGAEALLNTDVTVNKSSGTVVLLSALTLDAASQDLTLTSGTLDLEGQALTVNGTSGTMVVQTGAVLRLQGGETITANASNPSLQSGSTVYYDGSSGPYTLKDYTYHHLTVAGGASSVFTLAANESFGGNVTITSGILSQGGFTLTVTGTFSNEGTLRRLQTETFTGTMDVDSGTVEYVGDNDGSAETVTITDFGGGSTDYYNLKVNDSNATKDIFALGSSLTCAGQLQATSGTFQQSSNTIAAVNIVVDGGSFTGGSSAITLTSGVTVSAGSLTSTSGTLTVGANLTLSGGTFTHNSGTVVLNGTSQTLSGAWTFNHFTKSVSTAATLTLPAGVTTTVVGTLTLNGASGQLLSLRSSSTGSQASLDPQSTRTVSYLDVKDNNNVNVTAVTCSPRCANSGNNTNWTISSPAVTVTESSSSTNVTEGGSTDSYTLVLSVVPTDTVTVTVSPDSQVTVSATTFTFTVDNWSTPQMVTVTAVNDSIAEGTHSGLVSHSSASTDSGYSGIAISSVTASITDNEVAGVTVSSISGAVSEAASTATFTVVLTSQPSASVSIPLSSSDTTEGTVSASSVSFTTGNWSTPQTFTVTGVNDDLDDGDISFTIVTGASSSGDSSYNNLSPSDVSVTCTDNDSSGFTVSAMSGSPVEGGATATYTLVLTAEPTANVVVTLTGDAQAGVSPSTATFTSVNWSTPQTATVTAVNDSVAEGTHSATISHSVASSDLNYNNFALASVTPSITDNDTAGITVSAISGDVSEAATTASYTVVLTSQPTANVSVGVSSSDTTEGTVSAASVTFTSVNWSTPQTITVTGVNDDLDDGTVAFSIVNAASTSSDSNYSGVNPTDLSLNCTDDDTASMTLTQSDSSTAVTEGGSTDAYTLVLTTQPTANVVVTLTGSSQITLSSSTLTFTSGNWSTAQTLTVTAVDDSTVEGAHSTSISHVVSSDDTSYNGFILTDVSVTLADNDTEAVAATSTTTGVGFTAVSVNSTETENDQSGSGELSELQSTDAYIDFFNTGKDREAIYEATEALGVSVPEHWISGYLESLVQTDYLLELTEEIPTFTTVVKKMFSAPNTNITRGQSLEFLLVLSGVDITALTAESTESTFTDVESGSSLSALVNFADEENLIEGYTDGNFKPNHVINRAEALKMTAMFFQYDIDTSLRGAELLQANGLTENPFTDIDLNSWYAPYALYMHGKGIITGYEDKSYKPEQPITYAELLKVSVLAQNEWMTE